MITITNNQKVIIFLIISYILVLTGFVYSEFTEIIIYNERILPYRWDYILAGFIILFFLISILKKNGIVRKYIKEKNKNILTFVPFSLIIIISIVPIVINSTIIFLHTATAKKEERYVVVKRRVDSLSADCKKGFIFKFYPLTNDNKICNLDKNIYNKITTNDKVLLIVNSSYFGFEAITIMMKVK